MSDLQQDTLLHRIKANDQTALKSLFQQYYQMVAQAIFRLVQDQDLSNDLAQNVFVRFWEKRDHLEITSSLGAYLRRMAINEGLAHLRRNKTLESTDELPEHQEGQSGEELLLQSELKTQITQAINNLPPKCQLIFKLSRFEEMTYKDIAEKLDISVKTVENQMGKALRVLRGALKDYL